MKFANHHGGLSKESNSFMAGTRWKSLFGIPEYSAEIHLKRLKWKEPSQGAYPLRILMEWKSNCLTLRLDLLQKRSRLPSCCCMLSSFGCSAASLRPPARLLFQPFRCDDWLYCPIDPAFMLPRESHARGGFNMNLIGVRLQLSSTMNLIGQPR